MTIVFHFSVSVHLPPSKVQVMKTVLLLFLPCIAIINLTAVVECSKKKLDCYQWPGCTTSYNANRSRCESVCEKSHASCQKDPCLSDNFCCAFRDSAYGCVCRPECLEPPPCQFGYKFCHAWNDYECNEKQSSSEDDWSSSESSSYDLEAMMAAKNAASWD